MQPNARIQISLVALAVALFHPHTATADGKLQRPRNYSGSLEEQSQEAIIVLREKTDSEPAWEDLILKIQIGDEGPENFAWIIPFPNPPKAAPADGKYFKEIFEFVEAQKKEQIRSEPSGKAGLTIGGPGGVKVISRKTVGSYEVTVVREEQAGKLNAWLEENGYEPFHGASRILEQYRQRKFVFACIKVSASKPPPDAGNKGTDLHPLSFRFETGGIDAAFFPMVLTGLQTQKFNVNLYVFSRALLNHDENKFGYQHYGFQSEFQSGSPSSSRAGEGTNWSEVHADPKTVKNAGKIPGLQKWFLENHRGHRFYLTNLKAKDLDPFRIRLRDNDLWLFPRYYRNIIPYDARPGGPATSRWHQ